MGYPNGKAACSAESLECKLIISLKDVPLEVRREEAKKPLFLVRYE